MFRRRFQLIPVTTCIALAAALILPGCAGTVIGAGATAGTAAMEERGLSGAVDDTAIRLRLNALYSGDDERLWRKIGFQVYGGRVLLTGALDTPEMQARAVRLAWQAEGVTEVINEIEVAESDGITGYGRDTWIATQLKSRLLFDKEVSSINYSIDAVRGKVYLIGVAQSRKELNRVINHARGLDYVQKVVSYVRIKRPPENPS
jgi:osmotically-inducible protein OsmY